MSNEVRLKADTTIASVVSGDEANVVSGDKANVVSGFSRTSEETSWPGFTDC